MVYTFIQPLSRQRRQVCPTTIITAFQSNAIPNSNVPLCFSVKWLYIRTVLNYPQASERAASHDDHADYATVFPVHSCQSVECYSYEETVAQFKRPFVFYCWSIAASELQCCKNICTINIKYRILKAFVAVIRYVFPAEKVPRNMHSHISDVHRKEPWCIICALP